MYKNVFVFFMSYYLWRFQSLFLKYVLKTPLKCHNKKKLFMEWKFEKKVQHCINRIKSFLVKKGRKVDNMRRFELNVCYMIHLKFHVKILNERRLVGLCYVKKYGRSMIYSAAI